MLTKNDMKIGLKVRVPTLLDDGSFDLSPATVIGFDPYEEKWVAASPDWEFGVSHLEEDDYEQMELDDAEV